MLRGGRSTAKCPVAGCNKQWTKDSASLDKAFIYKMEKFLRSSQLQSQLLSENRDAEAVHIDDE